MAGNQLTPDFDDELLSAYVDNELTPSERAAVEERLRTDEQARQTLAELQRAADALKSLPARGLNRDLSANIWAAIDSQSADTQNARELGLITLPEREPAARSDRGRGRGLVWAALAVAAALMLMILRPGSELSEKGPVAASSQESATQEATMQGAVAEARKDAGADSRDMARQESVPSDIRATAAARQAVGAAGGDGGEALAVKPAPPSEAASRVALPRSRGGAAGADQAAAPQAMPNMATSVPSGASPSKYAADAMPEAAAAVEGVAADGGAVHLLTIEILAPGTDGVANFERMLAAHQIVMVDGERGRAVVPLAAASGAAEEAKTRSVDEMQSSAGRAGGVAEGQAAASAEGAVAILVEASPATIGEVLAALEPRTESRYAFRGGAEADALAGASVGGAATDSAATRGATALNSPTSRAWRVPLDAYVGEGEALADGVATESAAMRATAAAPGAGRESTAGGFGGRGVDAAGLPVRVLFIVRTE